MTGGYHSKRQRDRDRSLEDRVAAAPAPPRVDPAEPPRPCWIRWHTDESTAGHVLGWRRDTDGTWWALVLASVPQGAVSPRDPDR